MNFELKVLNQFVNEEGSKEEKEAWEKIKTVIEKQKTADLPKASSGYALLSAGWRSWKELPNWYSFRCIVKFEEFGIHGENNNHVCMGFWNHKEEKFIYDSKDYYKMTVKEWMPMYNEGI